MTNAHTCPTTPPLHSGSLILVNASLPCLAPPEPSDLVPIGSGPTPLYLERRAGNLLHMLLDAVDGWDDIVPVSGHRPHREQQEIWTQSVQDSGLDFTRRYVAVPGHSEHETGLAIDLALRQAHIDFIRPEFPYHGICQRFRDRAAQFGFIQRYPAGKEGVTGIAHEPWHFRYVGTPHAAVITELGLTLEEYHAYIRQFTYPNHPLVYTRHGSRVELFYLPATVFSHVWQPPDPGASYMSSGNNHDGYIITVWH